MSNLASWWWESARSSLYVRRQIYVYTSMPTLETRSDAVCDQLVDMPRPQH